MLDKSKFNSKKELRKFGISFGIVLFIIGTLQLLFKNNLYPYFYSGGTIILVIGLIFPILVKPLYILFSYLGFYISWIITRVVLITLYYLVATPIAILARIFGKRFLDLNFRDKKDSYWLERKPQFQQKEDYERQF